MSKYENAVASPPEESTQLTLLRWRAGSGCRTTAQQSRRIKGFQLFIDSIDLTDTKGKLYSSRVPCPTTTSILLLDTSLAKSTLSLRIQVAHCYSEPRSSPQRWCPTMCRREIQYSEFPRPGFLSMAYSVISLPPNHLSTKKMAR